MPRASWASRIPGAAFLSVWLTAASSAPSQCLAPSSRSVNYVKCISNVRMKGELSQIWTSSRDQTFSPKPPAIIVFVKAHAEEGPLFCILSFICVPLPPLNIWVPCLMAASRPRRQASEVRTGECWLLGRTAGTLGRRRRGTRDLKRGFLQQVLPSLRVQWLSCLVSRVSHED